MKKYLSILLIFILILSGCSSQNIEGMLTINSDDSNMIKIVKTAYNDIKKYEVAKDIAMLNMISQALNESLDYTDTIIIRDNHRELSSEYNGNYLILYNEGQYYIWSEDSVLIDIPQEETKNEVLPSVAVCQDYYKILNWILDNPDKFTYEENKNDDSNEINHIFTCKDVEFFKTQYYSTFGELPILEYFDNRFEIVITIIDGELSQFDIYGCDKDEFNYLEMATIFSQNLQSAYNSLGSSADNIWELLP